MFKPFWLAMQFLSRFPTPSYQEVSAEEVGRSTHWFPVVGLFIGLLLITVAQLHSWLPDPVVAALVLLFWIWSTGALHLDGLADSADGWLGGMGDPQRALAIMKDSRIGTGGGVALVGLLILKWSVLTVIIEQQVWLLLLVAPVIGRVASIALMPVTQYVSLNGIANDMFEHLNRSLIWGWLVVLSLALIWFNFLVFVALVLVWFWLRWLMIRITGGMTGDTAGAMVEVMEVAWLLAIAVVLIS